MKQLLKKVLTLTVFFISFAFCEQIPLSITINAQDDVPEASKKINGVQPNDLTISLNQQTIPDAQMKSEIIKSLLQSLSQKAQQTITHLHLNNNQLETLPLETIANLKNLFFLGLGGNNFNAATLSVDQLKNLATIINLKPVNPNWKISEKPELMLSVKPTLKGVSNLDLDASFKLTEENSEWIQNLIDSINHTKPQILFITIDAQRERMGSEFQSPLLKYIFSNLTNDTKENIRHLHIKNSYLQDLPDLSGLTNLLSLIAPNNDLMYTPDLTQNKKLWMVDLSENDLESEPKISKGVTVIDLSNNDTDAIEKFDQQLTILISPHIENYFSSLIINQDWQKLQAAYIKLVTLLNQNKPSRVRIWFTHPTSSPQNNRSQMVQYLLNTITNEAKSTIESLELYGNGLRLPPVLTGFSNLTNLDLHNNQLISPPRLEAIPKLITLYLNNNQITVAPFRLNTLLALKILDLSNNPLQTLVYVPAHLVDLEVIGVNAQNIHHEPIIHTIEQLQNILINSPVIARAYPDARIREHFINAFIGGDTGSIIAAGNPLGQWTIEDKITQAIRQEHQEQQRKTAPIGVIQREFYDTLTSDSREPKFFTAHSLDELKKKLQNELEKMEQALKDTETPEASIATALQEYGLNPATFNLNKMSEKTPILLLAATPRTLAESWHYWSTRGFSLDQFLELLQSGDQITSQDFTVPQSIAVDFLRDIGLTEQDSNELLSPYAKQDFVEFNEPLLTKLKELVAGKTTPKIIEATPSSKEPEQQEPDVERPTKRRRME
ncbi:leucine-rich repeat domain-containing protein [Candidatus Dependentiae bacterium]|nr:leucine-rich repeat domain-containing protein [Candidatus Dependentiae bacterium]